MRRGTRIALIKAMSAQKLSRAFVTTVQCLSLLFVNVLGGAGISYHFYTHTAGAIDVIVVLMWGLILFFLPAVV